MNYIYILGPMIQNFEYDNVDSEEKGNVVIFRLVQPDPHKNW